MGLIAARTTDQGPALTALGTELRTAAASGIAVCTWLATVLLAETLRRGNRQGPAESLLRKLTYRTGRTSRTSRQEKLSGQT